MQIKYKTININQLEDALADIPTLKLKIKLELNFFQKINKIKKDLNKKRLKIKTIIKKKYLIKNRLNLNLKKKLNF
jgi:uncharacterized protein (DUF302 family)